MSLALPGQVVCIRAGCSYPINVDTVRGIRHPFCSIECARACGETPRFQPQPTQVVRIPEVRPPAYTPAQETNATCINLTRLIKPSSKKQPKESSSEDSYMSPPRTDESPDASDNDWPDKKKA
ncbi:hypothetical protein BGZ58_000696 [Dissophora ornata]|nr:hypothetical protein BGZ58_000696 [Dissophora ornata]